jgi:S-adenosylmethionine decarboxylase
MKQLGGIHLIVDGYVSDSSVFNDRSVFSMFYSLVDLLGMQMLGEPSSTEVPLNESKLDSDDDDGGTSYYCEITTSHLSMHAWPLRNAFMLDIFSCKEFDAKLAFNLIRELLGVVAYNCYTLERADPYDAFPPPFVRSFTLTNHNSA